jgi:hypothetical protein
MKREREREREREKYGSKDNISSYSKRKTHELNKLCEFNIQKKIL